MVQFSAGRSNGTGPLGTGLTRVDVEIEGEAVGEGPEIMKAAQTEARGEFHFCLSREMQSLVGQVLVEAPPYRDRTYHLRIRFRREGYEAKTVERTIATGQRPERLDIHIARERVMTGL